MTGPDNNYHNPGQPRWESGPADGQYPTGGQYPSGGHYPVSGQHQVGGAYPPRGENPPAAPATGRPQAP